MTVLWMSVVVVDLYVASVGAMEKVVVFADAIEWFLRGPTKKGVFRGASNTKPNSPEHTAAAFSFEFNPHMCTPIQGDIPTSHL